jgi:5-methylcytosine-specific restriction protein A
MSKYAALSKHLAQLTSDSVRLPFSRIEQLIGERLPPSARKHPAWWANSKTKDSHRWAHLWLAAGWEKVGLDIEQGWVEFRRNDEPVKSGFSRVLSAYAQAYEQELTDHPLASYIRNDLPDVIKIASAETEQLTFKGSVGIGNWARGPWIGIFNPVVTNGAQRGYYPCYLFREDMRGVYLSLNQGMTEAKDHYKADAKTALRARAQNYRAMLGTQTSGFPELTIDLAPSSPGNDTAFYEAGNICAAYYARDAMPDEAQLVADLKSMLILYEALIQSETSSDDSLDAESDAPPNIDYEDATKFRMHKRIERNAALVKKVKQQKGYACQVCNANFETRYGAVGAGYIEAHHLKPIASLKGTKVAMDPAKDFAVLCSNCHRMVHRSGLVDDIERFKREHYDG